MAEFNDFLEGLLAAEGGYAPEDNMAGAVYMGVTQRFMDENRDALDLLGITARNPAELTRNDVAMIYRSLFWDRLELGALSNQRLANLIGHLAVNTGISRCTRILQQALNECGANLKVDGVFGPYTKSALRAAEPETVLGWVKYYALRWYLHLAVQSPSLYGDDLKGWDSRLASL